MIAEPNKILFPIPGPEENSHRMLIQVTPDIMSYVVMIIEGYDYIGIVRTVDQGEGIMEILVSPSFIEDARGIIRALGEEIGLKEIRV